jgi:hypothetical protein
MLAYVIVGTVIGILVIRFLDSMKALGKISPKLLLASPIILVFYVLGMIAAIASLALFPIGLVVGGSVFAILGTIYCAVLAAITLIGGVVYPFWKVASGIKAKHFPEPAKPITYSYIDRNYGPPLRFAGERRVWSKQTNW